MTHSVPYKTFYEHLKRFSAIEENEYAEILPYFSKKQCHKDDVLVKQGQKVTQTYWVVKGLLISTFLDENGKEHAIQFANEGCWITDQHAFYNGQLSKFNITCLENTVLLSITFADREKLCTDFPKMNTFFRRKGNDSFVKQQERLLTYMTQDATERFYLLIREYPDLIQRISKKVLASYLGVSRETLSRLRK